MVVRYGLLNGNSNSNNIGPRRNMPRGTGNEENVINLGPLGRNVYRVRWIQGGKTHYLFLNPGSAANLIATAHPGQGVRVNTLNNILALTGRNTVLFRHPTTRDPVKRSQVNKIANPRRPRSRSPPRRSPPRRSNVNRTRSGR